MGDDFLDRLGEAGFGLDDEGQPDGWSFTNTRAAGIQRWKERKDEAEFDALCKRLYQRNASRKHWHKLKEQFPERYQEVLAHHRRWYQENREKVEAARREKLLAEYKKNPIVNTCEECGTTWCVIPAFKRKLTSRFCDRRCRNRWHHKRRKPRCKPKS